MDSKVISKIIAELEKGRSLISICKDKGMPDRATIRRAQKADPDIDAAVMQAREDGYHRLAEEARIRAQNAEDPQRGRLAFDADRWYLGKLSHAFSDNKAQKLEHKLDISDKAKTWLGIKYGHEE